MLTKQLINGIRRYRRDRGLSIRGFAKLAGVSEFPIRGIDGPDWNPTFKTLEKFEQVIPPEFMAQSNDNETSSDPQATPHGRGDDHIEAA